MGDQDVTETLVFRYGTDMDPLFVLGETPGARFVARARLAGDADGTAGEAAGDVWGILLIQPEPATAVRTADVVTDDGRRTQATVVTTDAALADRDGVIAQARYWELSPAYIARLRR
jgi:hypothetical protein